ncbi:MAG: NAD(P)-binding protein, partial [Candidatus Hodarchaeales archaeon]
MPENMSDFSDNPPIIIGSGLGGLLTGALLAKNGYKPVIFDKLPFAGGRFTTHAYKGYAVPTGAVHMVPFGVNGFMAKILNEMLSLNLKLHLTSRFTSFIWPDQEKERYHQRYLGVINT